MTLNIETAFQGFFPNKLGWMINVDWQELSKINQLLRRRIREQYLSSSLETLRKAFITAVNNGDMIGAAFIIEWANDKLEHNLFGPESEYTVIDNE